MATEEKARVRQRRAISYVWTNSNEVLLDGEIGIEKVSGDVDLYKIGDGTTAWNDLPYLSEDTFSTASNNAILRKIAVQQGINSALGTDTRIPTQNENDALTGTYGFPSLSNKYVTDTDPRLLSGDFVSMDVYKRSTGTLSGRPLYITSVVYLEDPPPVSPANGDKVILSTNGGGTPDAGWPAGVVLGDIVEYMDSTWTKYTPEKGWSVYLGNLIYTFDGSAWNQSYRVSSDINDALGGTTGTPSSANPFVTDSDPRLVSVSEPYTFHVLASHSVNALTQTYLATATTAVTYVISGFTGVTSFTAADIRRFYVSYKYYVSNLDVCTMDYRDVSGTYFEVASGTGITIAPAPVVDAGGGGLAVLPVGLGQTNLVLRANVLLNGGGGAPTFWTYTLHGVDVRN